MYNKSGAKGFCRSQEISWLKTGRGSCSQFERLRSYLKHILQEPWLTMCIYLGGHWDFLLLFLFLFCFSNVMFWKTWLDQNWEKSLHDNPSWRALPLISSALCECFFTADLVFFEWKESVNLLTYIRGALTTYIFVLYILPSGGVQPWERKQIL